MIFIDRNGEKFEPEIVNAVLNGIEIDTKTHAGNTGDVENSGRGNSTEKTIDI